MRAQLVDVTPADPDQLRHLARVIGWGCVIGQLYPRSPRNQDRSARRVALRMSAPMVVPDSRLDPSTFALPNIVRGAGFSEAGVYSSQCNHEASRPYIPSGRQPGAD